MHNDNTLYCGQVLLGKTEYLFKIFFLVIQPPRPQQPPPRAPQTMSNRQFPPLLPDDAPKYGKPSKEALCASDAKHYPGQNQGQFCWSVILSFTCLRKDLINIK
jgi:hypothetical protein